MDPAETTKFVEQAFPNAREAICEFIRIPNQVKQHFDCLFLENDFKKNDNYFCVKLYF